ncbi:MAG: ABC transporter ATP-binding protein [Anaerolineae bacterium]|nr:ABC transporter ATP-binding protein [Anaerolineae bacterium]MDW8172773.1 ABC transporter ATP-binding protein [Anaerolineae bacterium]
MPYLEARNIYKTYPNGVRANQGVSLSVEEGEIHAIVGENGAGKSTLMKILYGIEMPTEGQIFLRNQPVTIDSPQRAIQLGIGMVFQNFMLVNSFTIAENITLGTEPRRGLVVDRKQAIEATERLASIYGLQVDPRARVEDVSVGMRQRVEILKALYRGAQVLILDEPTAVLTPRETTDLFDAIHNLIQEGKTVIFITHKLREVMEISHRVTVMRDARHVGTVKTSETNIPQLARMMVGREVFMVVDKPLVQRGKPVLQVRNLSYANEGGRLLLKHANFTVYEGEILGVAGVEGNGQTELVEILTGLRPPSEGEALVDGQSILGHGPRQAREAHVAHIPEDRLTNGIAPDISIADNLIVDRYYRPPFTQSGLMRPQAINANGQKLIRDFGIVAMHADVPVISLSGGNMQKVIVAREFSSEPRLLIAAQPTRGVDIGAIEFIHQQLVDKRTQGLAILLVSADLQEVMKLADRIMVMYDGEIVAILPNTPDLTEERLGLYMLGAQKQSATEMETYS